MFHKEIITMSESLKVMKGSLSCNLPSCLPACLSESQFYNVHLFSEFMTLNLFFSPYSVSTLSPSFAVSARISRFLEAHVFACLCMGMRMCWERP